MIRVGVSACLVGDTVRWDGGSKRDAWIADVLGRSVEIVRVCPEVELGLGTPREPIALVRRAGVVRLQGVETQRDLTDEMRAYARQRVEELASLDLAGFVAKSGSPSCGLDVVVEDVGRGRGLFVEALLERLPDLVVIDERALAIERERRSFLERIGLAG